MAQGRNTISQRISIEGALDVIRSLQEMGSAGEKAIGQIRSAVETTNSTTGQIGRFTDSLRSHFNAVKEHLEPVRESFHKFGEAINHTTEQVFPHFKEIAVLSIAGISAELFHLSREAAEANRNLHNMAGNLGVDTHQLEEMRLAAALAGVEVDDFDKSAARLLRNVGQFQLKNLKDGINDVVPVLRGVQKEMVNTDNVLRGGVNSISEAISGKINIVRGKMAELSSATKKVADDTKDAGDAFKLLGLTADDFANKTPAEKIQKIALALAGIRDATHRAAIAQDLLSRSWVTGLPALLKLESGIEEARHFIHRFGLEIIEQEDLSSKK
jgi:prophage DNA circulation protein